MLRVEGDVLLDALDTALGLRPALDLSSTAPEYRSRRARLRWWTTRAGQRHDRRLPPVVVIDAGYEGKRRYYQQLAELGARLVIVDETEHCR